MLPGRCSERYSAPVPDSRTRGEAAINLLDTLPSANPAEAAGGLPVPPQPLPARALRIALLGYRSKPTGGGQGVYLRYLSRALAEAGHEVDVISGPPYPELDPGVRLIRIPSLDLFENGLLSLRPRHLGSMSNLLEWLSKLTGGFAEPYTFGRRVVKYLRRHGHRYDLVHDNQSLSFGMLELQAMGLPLVTTIHHPITSDFRIALAAAPRWYDRLLVRRWYSFLRMQRTVARQLRHVVTVSDCSRQDIARDFGLQPAGIELVPNGIDTEVFRPRPEVPRNPHRLMSIASADSPLKGLRYLLEAFASLLRRQPALELILVSRPEPGGTTEQLIRQLGIGPRLRIVNGISTGEMVRLYAEASIAVVPSLYEGFGLPAGEAMACGVPVVSTDGGALTEVVGDAGVIVPAGDAVALEQAIASLLADSARQRELGERARQRILERFCWTVCARDMEALYRRVIDHADG